MASNFKETLVQYTLATLIKGSPNPNICNNINNADSIYTTSLNKNHHIKCY